MASCHSRALTLGLGWSGDAHGPQLLQRGLVPLGLGLGEDPRHNGLRSQPLTVTDGKSLAKNPANILWQRDATKKALGAV